MMFSKRKLHFWFLSCLCWKQRNRKKKNKQNGKRPKKPIKIVFFKVVIQKMRKWIFFQKLPDTVCVRKGEKSAHFRAHYLFWPKSFFFLDQNSQKPGKTIKIVVSAEISQNLKWHLFSKWCFFWHGWKSGFTNCVFEKLCSSENTIFIVFSAKHSSCNKKAVCWKKEKIYEKLWVVLNMAKMVFFFVFFEVFMVLWFVFCVSGKVAKVLKMLVFLQFWGLLRGGLFLFIWVWKV